MTRNPELQFRPAAEIKAWQEARLAEELAYLNARSPFYREMFAREGINPARIVRIEDLVRIPVTTKKDIQTRNRDFLCVDTREAVDYVTTSGTLGDPVTFALTDGDLTRLSYNEYLSFTTAGCTSGDIMQLMTTIDRRFMAGLAYFMGARELGCGVVRVGNGIPELQWDTIRRIEPNVCVVIPSFLLKMLEYAAANGIDAARSPLRKAICIGEPLRNSDCSLNRLGKKIIEEWPSLTLHSTYASTEMQSSFTECEHGCGGHHQPELIIVEFLDDNDRPVPEGEPGEVTITTLGVRGMPLLRFKTGDVCAHTSEPCACGRTTMRLSPLLGRKGQMIKYKGTTLYPPALYDILDNVPGIASYIVEVRTNDVGTDEIEVRIGCENPSDDFAKQLKDLFRSKIRVAPGIRFETPAQLSKIQYPEISRKPIKFVDLRNGEK